VEFSDGQLCEYTANLIAENVFSMCDDHGNQFLLFNAIVDHVSDPQATKKVYTKVNDHKFAKKSTAGWKMCVRWRDGFTS